ACGHVTFLGFKGRVSPIAFFGETSGEIGETVIAAPQPAQAVSSAGGRRSMVALINRRSLPYRSTSTFPNAGGYPVNAEQPPRIIVAGTGPVGLIAALALADLGMPVTLAGPAPSSEDRRTTALMTPALAQLDGIGVLAALQPKAAPLKVMRIVDATKRLVRGPVVTFRAAEIGE